MLTCLCCLRKYHHSGVKSAQLRVATPNRSSNANLFMPSTPVVHVWIESHGRMVSTPASYSWGGVPGFKSRLEERQSWQTFSWFSSVTRGQYRDDSLNKTTIPSFHIISNSFLINLSNIRRYNNWVTESVAKYTQNRIQFNDLRHELHMVLLFWVLAPCRHVGRWQRSLKPTSQHGAKTQNIITAVKTSNHAWASYVRFVAYSQLLWKTNQKRIYIYRKSRSVYTLL
jgi:hypothetical protein